MEFMKRMLQISLIPRTTWYNNVRSAVPRGVWTRIRLLAAKPQCQICGCKGRLFTHEVWRYDDIGHVQRLAGFVCLCYLCHAVKHLGFASVMAQRGDLDYDQLVKHYCVVNGCSIADFVTDRDEAFCVWRRRSQYEWSLDLSYLNIFLSEESDVRSLR